MAMKWNCSKLISLCLVLCMMLSLAVCASAAEIDTSGGSGTTPVSLTTTNGGIGGGAQVQTDASDAASQALLTAPMTGCYLSGVGDASGNAVDVAYAAIVTPLSQAVTNATVANVVFVVEWDT